MSTTNSTTSTAPTTSPTSSFLSTTTTEDVTTTHTTTSTPLTTSTTSTTTSTSSTPTTSSTPISTTSTSTTQTSIPTTTPPVTIYNTYTTGGSTSSTTSTSSASVTAGLSSQGKSSSSSGLSGGGKIAVAVVVPIVAVALIVLGLLFLWRKRKQRKDAEELRRKEVEEYGYNPNNDPTLPAVGGTSASGDGPFEMREEGSSGYRGWGTTAVGSTGQKASTTLSGSQSTRGVGVAYSEGTSPTRGPISDTRSDNQLLDNRLPGEAEALGAMGPAASGNRTADINRGPSNASSQYSTAARSDGSGEPGIPGGAYGAAQYYSNEQYDNGNPYGETHYGSPPGRAEMSGQPIIRDVQARRNTRIENPSHFPQQSSGIAQNF